MIVISKNIITEDIFVSKSKKKLKVIPLGGLMEIGKNITLFEYGDEIIIVDCGVIFPEDDMLGIDLVIPDFTYLVKNKEKVKALFLTHGHEDHIGSTPYLLKKFNVPIYGTKLTLGLLEHKLEEHNLLASSQLNVVTPGQKVTIGSFVVEFIATTHSIADSVALAIHTPVGIVVHTSDFKIDYTPIEGQSIDLARFAELGKQGVLLLLADSTNVEEKGYTVSERTVGETFNKLFLGAQGRIIVATFASNVHRIQQIINSAIKNNRKVAFSGRSMLNVLDVASRLGYMKIPEGVLIDIDEVKNYPLDKIVMITTGSQGEPMSALSRMAASVHRQIDILPGDTVIMSSSTIPGNEKTISKVINELFKKGAEVIYESIAEVHVSGHACQEELKIIHSLVKPKFFMPVHGEYKHLKLHANLAENLGINKENIFISDLGKVLELTATSAKISTSVPSGRVFVDGLGIGDVGSVVLRDRKLLSEDGLIIVVLTLEAGTGNIVAGPDVISRGFVYVKESERLMDQVREITKSSIYKLDSRKRADWASIKTAIRDNLRDYIYEKTKRKPMILPIIMEVSI